jgi:hypothetical protein
MGWAPHPCSPTTIGRLSNKPVVTVLEVFEVETFMFHCNCDAKFFCCDPRPPVLASHRLCRLVLSNGVLELHWCSLHLHLQYSIACLLFSCLCSRFACREKPSWRGQSSCAWLITNGAVV